jgi:hypothetical protein
MDEQRNGDDVIERLDVQGGSKGEIYKTADAMGRLVIENKQRWLMFSPTDAAFGKNPGQLEPLKVPHFESADFEGFLGRVIQQTKDRLNEASEAQKEAVAEQEWFRATLAKVNSVEQLNGLLGRAANAPQACKVMMRDKATSIGAHYDKARSEFVIASKEAA